VVVERKRGKKASATGKASIRLQELNESSTRAQREHTYSPGAFFRVKQQNREIGESQDGAQVNGMEGESDDNDIQGYVPVSKPIVDDG